MNFKSIPMLAVASSLSLAMTACSGNTDTADTDAATTDTATTAAATTPAADHAAQFLTDVIQTNNAEIKFGQAAQSMGSTQAVRDFGKMLVDDHTKANQQASQIATAMNMVVPTSITPEHMAEYNRVTGMTGADFDKAFAAAMADGHQKAVDMFTQEAGGGDPVQVTDFAKQTLPTLQKHLETAQSLQK